MKNSKQEYFVFKINISKLKDFNWNLNLTLQQARKNKELIMLSESQILRFINELNNKPNINYKIHKIKKEINLLKKEKNIKYSKPKIIKLYENLDELQFIKDYVCVVIDNITDYNYISKKGFKINNITYKRLLGTAGGVKERTIVFVNENLLLELNKRIDNGRNVNIPFSPAKLESYKSLVCSSSTPVSYPNGVVVVEDCITKFQANVIELNDENLVEPSMKYVENKEITLIDSDGYGLAMPNLMQRWGQELGKNYILPGCVIRNSFCKGTVYPIDFQKFAKEHNIKYITDVWGNEYDINNIELILTKSMLKLWNSYSSIEDYLYNCKNNNYTFAITKASEERLENVRNMNYQFLQVYDFTDEQIDDLIKPTIDKIKDILSNDYRKTILYAKGINLNEHNIKNLDDSFVTAMMIEPTIINDPYVKSRLNNMLQKQMNEAKVGVLQVEGNYSLVSGDPYSLCQSMFKLPITGLLKQGEVYSKYWKDKNVDKIVSFRAPMSNYNNVRLLNVVSNKKMDDFYKYMTTPTIFNSWDTCADAMNGFDKDGDCVINTSNSILINNTKETPAIMCIQRNAPKCIPSEDDFIKANIKSFGNEIGAITNKVTSMFEVQARFPQNSREYRILDYRIKCGQLYQQNEIDSAKGIEVKSMPKKWYNFKANEISREFTSSENSKNLINRYILANKKPYFMQYIYPKEKKIFIEYIKRNQEKCIMKFRLTLDELLNKKNKSKEELNFINYYNSNMPLGMSHCTMNKICWKVESELKYFKLLNDNTSFDYNILKSKNVNYNKSLYYKIKKIYDDYMIEIKNLAKNIQNVKFDTTQLQVEKYMLKCEFKKRCTMVCPNEDYLCNIVLDICYSKNKKNKHFAWDICGDIFIKNLLIKNNNIISYPTLDENGDIEFDGLKFSMKSISIENII